MLQWLIKLKEKGKNIDAEVFTIFVKKTHVMTSSQLLITLGLNHHECYRPFIPFFFIIMSLIACNPILQS